MNRTIPHVVLAIGLAVTVTAPASPTHAFGEGHAKRIDLPAPSAGYGVVRGGRLEPGDFDRFRVYAHAGSLLALAVHTHDRGEFDDPILGVRPPGASDFELLSDDGGPGFLPRGTVAIDRRGVWEIAVSGFGDEEFVGEHEERLRYRLSIAAIKRPEVVHEAEPRNDDPERAPWLLGGLRRWSVAVVTGSLEPGDIDHFRIPGYHPRDVEVSLFDARGGEFNDSVVRLLDANGEALADNDDGGPLFLSNLGLRRRCGSTVVAIDGYDANPEDDILHREDFVYHLVVTVRRQGKWSSLGCAKGS